MAYVTPSTALTGDLISAADWNKNTVDNPIALKALIDAIGTTGLNRCDGRLTLTTGTPVTTADVTAATTLYWTPYAGNQVALYDGSAWAMYTFTERSIAVPATTSQMYDVFVYNNTGTITLELTAWTNDTTRATALTTQNGVYVKTGALTRRYLGSFRTTTVSGQTEDSATKRFVSNYYNRRNRLLQKLITTDSYTYTISVLRQWEGSSTNQVAIVVGVAEDVFNLQALHSGQNSSANVELRIGIGEGSTTSMVSSLRTGRTLGIPANQTSNMMAILQKLPAVGYQFYAGLEQSDATGTTTWLGDVGGTTAEQGGLLGGIQG